MRGILAVAGRELRERRNLLLAAPLLALVPLLAPYLPGLTRVPPGEARLAFTVLLAFVLPLALALGLGASATGDEVAGRRLGFFFSRPLSAFAIWGGKMAVALLLPVAVSVLILGPLVLHARSRGGHMPWGGYSLLAWAVILTASWVLGSLAHVAVGLYRTRSRLLGLDLALAGVLGGAFYLVGWRVLDAGASWPGSVWGPDSALPWTASAWLVALCLGAGYTQVTVGRSDPRRGHLATSLVLWGGLALSLAAASAWAIWLLNPSPARLFYRVVTPLAEGHHFLLEGLAAGPGSAGATFLVDARDGTARRITHGTASVLSSIGMSGAVPSPNGRHVLFLEGRLEPRLVVVSAPAGSAPVVSRAPLEDGREGWPLCLSDDGMLAVLFRGSYGRVVDTATGKDRPLPPLEAASQCTFEPSRRLVLYGTDYNRRTAYRRVLELDTGALSGRVEYPGSDRVLAACANRILTRIGPASRAEIGLFDADRGQLLQRLGVTTFWGLEPGAGFLPDGEVAFIDGAEPGNTLRVLDPEGRARFATGISAEGKATFAGVSPDGDLYVVVRKDAGQTTLVIDPRAGATKLRIEGLRPAGGVSLAHPATSCAASATRFRLGLFLDTEGAIVHVDPDSGERRTLLAAGPAPAAGPP